MALIKVKLADGTCKFINDTEYVGVCSAGILDAKCFPKGFNDPNAIRGISKLWSLPGYLSSKAILETSAAKLGGLINNKYFHLLLHSWFQLCNKSLEVGIQPVFRREIELRSTISGKPDFFKSEAMNKGILGSVISVVSRLGLDLPELIVIKDAYELVLRSDNLLPSDRALRASMISTLNRGLAILHVVPHSDNPRKNASQVLNRVYLNEAEKLARLPPKLRHLSRASAFCSGIILNKPDGVEKSERGQNGLLLNMNYLLQNFLKEICEANSRPRNHSRFSESTNFIEHGISMNPDTYGLHVDGYHYILDAKHKIFSADNSSKTNNPILGNEDSYSSISREDFFQIISYSTTHHATENGAVYGLVGLWTTRDPINEAYIKKTMPPTKISYRASDGTMKVKIISKIALNFARVLHEVGKGTSHRDIVLEVSRELFSKLHDDACANNTPAEQKQSA